MAPAGYAAVILPLLLSISSISLSQCIIQPHSDEFYCDSWRFSEETNDAGNWKKIPAKCGDYVAAYMTGDRYSSDSAVVTEFALAFAKTVAVARDGSDAWVFDIDETLFRTMLKTDLGGFRCKRWKVTRVCV